MIDFIKDGAEAWLQRIRSPLLGSVLLVFVAWNWKAIYFVLFSDTPIFIRFWYFDHQTSISSLLFVPIGLGMCIGVATPFINVFGSYFAKWPIERLRLIQAESAHSIMLRKAELETNREILSADYKEAALREAEASQAIRDAELDDETREKLEEKISKKREPEATEQFRVRVDNKPSEFAADEAARGLGKREKATIIAMGKVAKPVAPHDLGENSNLFELELSSVLNDLTPVRLRVELQDSLGKLKNSQLADKDVYDRWTLSSRGYQVFDVLKPF